MNTYQITANQLRQAADAALAGKPDKREHGTGRFVFKNGAHTDVVLHAGRIKDWARTFDKADTLQVALLPGSVEFTVNGSFLKMENCNEDAVPRAFYEPVILDAPESGGMFTLSTDKKTVEQRKGRRDSLETHLNDWNAATANLKRDAKELAGAYIECRDALPICQSVSMATELENARKLRHAVRQHRKARHWVYGEIVAKCPGMVGNSVKPAMPAIEDSEYSLYFSAADISEIKALWEVYENKQAVITEAMGNRRKGTKQQHREVYSALSAVQCRVLESISRVLQKDAPGWYPGMRKQVSDIHKARLAIREFLHGRKERFVKIKEHAAEVAKHKATFDAVDKQRDVASTTPPEILAACKTLAPFTTDDETRYVLERILFERDASTGNQVACATDGRRLAILKGDYGLKHDPNAVVRVLYNTNGMPEIEPMTFPCWRQVIPAEFKAQTMLPVESMIAALKQAAKLTSDKSQSVRLVFENDTLTITGATPDVGDGVAQVPCRWNDKASAIAFNPYYVLDAFNAAKKLGYKELVFRYTDELSPGEFESEDGTYRCVIMPMRMS